MTRTTRILAPLALAGIALGPGLAHAATHGHARGATPPKPVSVYVGSRLVASGQSLSNAIRTVRSKVPFTIRTPRYTPKGYTAAQLSVTPQQRDVSHGYSTLVFAMTSGKTAHVATASGFQIDQSSSAIPFVGGSRVVTTTVGSSPATLHELKAAGHDIMILTWIDSAGRGYDIVTDAVVSHLSFSTLRKIAASLH